MDTLFVPADVQHLLPCMPSGVSMHLGVVTGGFYSKFSVYGSIHFLDVSIFVLTKHYFI
jgi:hypothetical protein